MKRIIFLAVLIAAIAAAPAIDAQGNAKTHDLLLSVGGGLSNLNNSSTVLGELPTALDVSFEPSFGVSFGLGYIYYFVEHFGINTGLEESMLKGTGKFPNFNDSYQTDAAGSDRFDFRYTVGNFSETQSAYYLNIPLMLRFQKGRIYAAGGIKIGIPLRSTYINEIERLQTKGFYPDTGLELPATVAGFGEYRSITGSGTANFSTAFLLSTEIGAKWEINGKIMFYTGLYLDYGFAYAYYTGTNKHLIEYGNSDNYQANALIASSLESGKGLIDELSPLSFGIKIGLSIGSARWWVRGR